MWNFGRAHTISSFKRCGGGPVVPSACPGGSGLGQAHAVVTDCVVIASWGSPGVLLRRPDPRTMGIVRSGNKNMVPAPEDSLSTHETGRTQKDAGRWNMRKRRDDCCKAAARSILIRRMCLVEPRRRQNSGPDPRIFSLNLIKSYKAATTMNLF